MKISNIVIVVCCILLLCGCGASGCYENRNSIPRVALYAYNSPTQTIVADSITIYGVGQKSDSLLIECARVSSFTLPFRNDADTTSYVIRYDAKRLAANHITDTLTFAYRRYPYFISAECGVTFNYLIDTLIYTSHLLDSAALQVDEVTNNDIETLRLYYYVAQ